ncbi:uncharacterized protein LOC102809071 [Saccoglossus kowalevskii]|uniref:Uncharacterized protein LOC102809071 n=1 Tax=Saccoglossus kowalevskii TaxID=10224 RepID=A0ABM0MTV0_SACKO|nr:PREDICTED: uncharacterized protein LOC102809071 [Saccoglossus kowalevskii]
MCATLLLALVVVYSDCIRAVQGDTSCIALSGTCQEDNIICNNGDYQTGLCSGHAHRRCCVPGPDHQCLSLGGTCQNDDLFCAGNFTSNLCGGIATRRCCVPPEPCANYNVDGDIERFCAGNFQVVPEQNIEVTFRLYTRATPDGDIVTQPTRQLHGSYIQGMPTKFIVHGYRDKATKPWVTDMVKELLEVDNCNVITVDWHEAAKTIPNRSTYNQASSNTRIVASWVKRFIAFLKISVGDTVFTDIHLIGHSLGSQICGMVGKWITDKTCGGQPCRISRITALDPARPNFLEPTGNNRPPSQYCVQRGDAMFVDVIHTDATEEKDESDSITNTFGIFRALGDADFYPNGGNKQPGCNVYCDHGRAVELFTASINSRCSFIADTCNTLGALRAESCTICTSPPCQRMGYHASPTHTPSMYFLTTTSKEPFCAHTLGCYEDRSLSPDMDHKSSSVITSVDICLSYCRARAYMYAGLQYTSSQLSCWCGDTYGKYGEVDASKCTHKCRDSVKGITCGGHLHNSVYETGYIGCVDSSAFSVMEKWTEPNTICPHYCLAKCTKEGYEYAGLSKGDTCSCGNDQQFSNLVSRSRCLTACTGRSDGVVCGGGTEMAVIRTGIESTCIQLALEGDCDFFKCFSERHSTCSKYDIGGVLYSRCQGLAQSIRYILSDRKEIFKCVALKMLAEYKQLEQTYSTTKCKQMYKDGKKHYKSCAKEPNQSNKRRSASSEENSFFDRLKDSDNLDDYKASIDDLIAAVESDPESLLLEFMQEEVEELTLYFHRSGFHTHDDVLQTMVDAIEMKMVEGASSINSKSSSGDSCEDLATGGNCAFFDCFEKRFPCGPSGFALSFGKIYCEQENKYKNYLKATGGISMQSVQTCVMNAILTEYQKDENTCKGIELTMIAAYRDCYGQYLNCDFVRDNQFQLTNIYALPQLSSTTLQDVAKSLVVTTLCDNHGSTLYSIIDNVKFLIN